MKEIKIKSFFHQKLVDILCAGVPISCGEGSEDKVILNIFDNNGERIKAGFCYSLVVDWLDCPQFANNKYWNTCIKSEQIRQCTSDEQYGYFVKIGLLFEKYCENYKSKIEGNKKTEIIFLCEGIKGAYSFATLDFLEIINEWYLKESKCTMRFNESGEFIYTAAVLDDLSDKTSEKISLMKINKLKNFFRLFDNEQNLYCAVLLNLYFFNTIDNTEFRHSIGIHKKSVVVEGDQASYPYAIFDPNIGVYEVDNLFKAVNECIINGKYGKHNYILVGCQYFMAKCNEKSYYE